MTFIAFDLETTGFLPGVDRIVEIGAVKFEQGKATSVFSTLVDPQMPIPEAASKVNGISNEMVVGKPTIESLLHTFADFCEGHIVVAHNAGFDVQFLTADIQKFESPAPTGVILDTLALARKVYPGLPNYKLGTLVQHLGIQATDFHRAEEDASYCGQLYWNMLERMAAGGALPPVDNLVQMTGKPEMRFPQITPQPKQLGLFDL